MNEMADSLRYLVGSVQNAKEIGIIENTQVINIIDSIVQNSTIGAGARKCPECGSVVEANEKSCPECGGKL